ncbi:MAG: hypothetical protein D6675_13785 [Gemmatimonadetes bacterium]|nr:MAG: hypothetical protein D6675_13785 [Gemmatimonadota bacterium]
MCKYGIFMVLAFLWIPVSRTGAISLMEYRPPISKSENLQLDASYNYAGQDSTTSDVGSASVRYFRIFDSQPFAYRLEFNSVLGYDGLNEDQTVYNPTTQQTVVLNRHKTTLTVDARSEFRKYILLEKLFGTISSQMRYVRGKGESLKKQVTGKDTTYAVLSETYARPEVMLATGIGYGKFVNATPLVRAIRVEQELARIDALMGNLPNETLIELAKLLTPEKQREYQNRFEPSVWERYYYADIQKVLLTSGLLKGDRLSAFAVLRIQQVLAENINDRSYGWDAAVVTQYVVISRRSGESDQNAGMGLYTNYAYPFNSKTQLSHNLSLLTRFSPLLKENSLLSTLNVTYEASDRVDWRTTYQLSLEFTNLHRAELAQHAISTNLIFYVEGHINLTLSGSLSKTIIQNSSEAWLKKINLSLTYDII